MHDETNGASSSSKGNIYQSHPDHDQGGHDNDENASQDDVYTDTDQPVFGGFFSKNCYYLQKHWKIIVLGQGLSFCLATAGAAQATLHLNCRLNAPTFTMATVYLVLAVIHLTLLTRSQGKLQREQRHFASTTHQVLLVDQPQYHFSSWIQLQRPVWQYAIMATLDVEANAITMLAFKYTTLTSITLLDAIAIPSAMLISRYTLGRQYTSIHLTGVIVCMVGVVVNVLQDAASDKNPTTSDQENYPHKFWGDLLATTGGILYGLNDVLAEATVRNNASTTEYLAMVGLFGFLLSLVQALMLEWDEILRFFGHSQKASSTCPLPHGWGLLALFVCVTLTSYMGASRFLMISEAAFFNLSLLTGDLWSVVFSIVAEHRVPPSPFFVALTFVLSGVVLYEMAPHPVVDGDADAANDTATAQQLADIDNEFELQESSADGYDYDEDAYDEDGMELL